MKQTAFDRIISKLPPENQAAGMDALLLLSQHPDGPIYTLYAEMFERLERVEKETTALVTLHAANTKSALNTEIAKHFAEQKQSAEKLQSALHGGKVWRKVAVSTITCLVISAVISVTTAYSVVKSLMVKTTAETEEILGTLGKKPELLVKLAEATRDNASYSLETAQVMSLFASALNQRGVATKNSDGITYLQYEGVEIKKDTQGKEWVIFPPPQNDNITDRQRKEKELRDLQESLGK